MWEYTETVREHFAHPRNAGKLEDANAIGEVGSIACGDALKLYLKINEKGIIEKASFETFGCASAIASSSALTEIIIGKTVEEASKVTNKEIAAYLGGLPAAKMHCSVMGEEALDAAIRNWRGEPAKPQCHEDNIVCKCFAVSEAQIRHAIRENSLKTVEDVTHFTKAGGGCGDCKAKIQLILDDELGKTPLTPFNIVPKRPLTNVARMQKVMHVIEDTLRPRLTTDGGDIELVDVDGYKVTVHLTGKCSTCRTRHSTLKDLVESTLREQVEEEIFVVEA